MLLRDYLRSEKIMVKHFAEMLGKNAIYVSCLLNNRRRPSLKVARRIEQITNGRVSRMEVLYPEDYTEKVGENEQVRMNVCPGCN